MEEIDERAIDLNSSTCFGNMNEFLDDKLRLVTMRVGEKKTTTAKINSAKFEKKVLNANNADLKARNNKLVTKVESLNRSKKTLI